MGTIVTYTYNDGVATISMDDGKANVLSHTDSTLRKWLKGLSKRFC